jgi:CelD/BcsL family acetyltransferase involved in cellulose biosynthesis
MGNLEFKLIKRSPSLEHHIDLYYQVYGKSWQEQEGIGPNFHRDLAKMASRNDWLRLGFLLLNDSPIATQFWISCQNYSYILKTVYDQAYRKYSPGKILTSDMIKYALDIDKVRVIDYVQGDEPYKKDWTPKRRERKGLVVFNNNTKGRYLTLLTNRIEPLAKRVKFFQKAKEIARTVK